MKKFLKEHKCMILKEVSKNLLYTVSNSILHHNHFLISKVNDDILLSITVGEIQDKFLNMPTPQKETFCLKFLNCFKTAHYVSKPISNLIYEELTINDIGYYTTPLFLDESLKENSITLYNEFYEIDKKFILKFKFSSDKFNDKLLTIQNYLDFNKKELFKIIKS